jgi:hypothetical protein
MIRSLDVFSSYLIAATTEDGIPLIGWSLFHNQKIMPCFEKPTEYFSNKKNLKIN